MIIGLSVKNRFASLEPLDDLANRVATGTFTYDPRPDDDADPAVKARWFDDRVALENELRATMTNDDPSPAASQALARAIRRAWASVLAGHPNSTLSADSLTVVFPDVVSGRDRDGRQYYVFPSARENKVIIL